MLSQNEIHDTRVPSLPIRNEKARGSNPLSSTHESRAGTGLPALLCTHRVPKSVSEHTEHRACIEEYIEARVIEWAMSGESPARICKAVEILERRLTPEGTRCALYRHFDGSGVLLYVGIAYRPHIRTEQHRALSPWFALVEDTSIEWRASRDLAAAAERQAIRDERPLFNVSGTVDKTRSEAIAYLLERLAIAERVAVAS